MIAFSAPRACRWQSSRKWLATWAGSKELVANVIAKKRETALERGPSVNGHSEISPARACGKDKGSKGDESNARH